MIRLVLTKDLDKFGVRAKILQLINQGEDGEEIIDEMCEDTDVCLVSDGDVVMSGNLQLDNPTSSGDFAGADLYGALGMLGIQEGLLITRLESPDCPLAKAGVEVGDLITSALCTPLLTVEGAKQTFNDTSGMFEPHAVNLEVYKGFKHHVITIPVEDCDDWLQGAGIIDRYSINFDENSGYLEDADYEEDRFIQSVFILGNLTVDGGIFDKSGNSLAYFCVTGHLKARGILQNMTDIYVGDGATIEGALICQMDEGTGISIQGKTTAKYLIGKEWQFEFDDIDVPHKIQDISDYDLGDSEEYGEIISMMIAGSGVLDDEKMKQWVSE